MKLFGGRVLRRWLDGEPHSDSENPTNDRVEVTNPADADLVCSDLGPGKKHMPLIDFDVPVTLVPSGTPGHSHLYIDVPINETRFFDMLDAMAKAGVVEHGFADLSRKRGFASVRVPWKPKGVK